MFSRRRVLNGSRHYTREFFETFVADLARAGFSLIEIRLPYNVTGVGEDVLSAEEFLDRDRNYPALLIVATNSERHETLKVLLINRDAKTLFVDDTFPSGESEPPSIYFQSPDPGRTFSVFEFFFEYVSRPSMARHRFLWFASLLAFLAVISETIAFVFTGAGILSSRFGYWPGIDLAVFIFSCIVIYGFFREPKGLWIKPQRDARVTQLIKMALRGDLRDNPVVSLIVTVLGAIFAALLLKWLGVLE